MLPTVADSKYLDGESSLRGSCVWLELDRNREVWNSREVVSVTVKNTNRRVRSQSLSRRPEENKRKEGSYSPLERNEKGWSGGLPKKDE